MTVAIGELCKEIKNYFQKKIYFGDFEISDGSLSLDFLQNGQYFRIVGSVFNDGVYVYPPASGTLTDELFNGAIWAMAVPPDVMALLSDINDYQKSIDSKKDIIDSPYQSESFGGYSYTKGSGSGAVGVAGADDYTWQAKFKNRLNRWRKVREL